MRSRGFGAGPGAYWQQHLPYYVLVTLVFVSGVVFGALALRTLEPQQVSELAAYMDKFLSGLRSQLAQTSGRTVLRDSLSLDLKTLGLIYVLGLTVIGVPVILAVVFIRGFVIGFTVGFLAYERGLGGILFAVAAIVPQNVFIIPALVFASVTSIMFSALIVRSRRPGWQLSLGSEFVGYSALLTAAVLAVTAGALVKAYVSPVFMNVVGRLVL